MTTIPVSKYLIAIALLAVGYFLGSQLISVHGGNQGLAVPIDLVFGTAAGIAIANKSPKKASEQVPS